MLYPPDVFNENFMRKLRDCVVKLKEDHPVKKWLHWVSKSKSIPEGEQKRLTFANEVLNSQFNLITDTNVRNGIIELIAEIKGETLTEKLLRSYLFLMLGNITKSDNIIKEIIQRPPVQNWSGYRSRPAAYNKVILDNLPNIFSKMTKHPSDRKVFEMFILYLKNFSNDPALLEILSENENDLLSGKLGLKYTAKSAPDLIHFLRLAPVSVTQRVKVLRKTEWFNTTDLFYWVTPFLDIDPLISEKMLPELTKLEAENQLWFVYVMDDEKLADLYARKEGKGFIPGRRHYLRSHLQVAPDFMLTLFKLIELGDIDHSLVEQTVNFITHE